MTRSRCVWVFIAFVIAEYIFFLYYGTYCAIYTASCTKELVEQIGLTVTSVEPIPCSEIPKMFAQQTNFVSPVNSEGIVYARINSSVISTENLPNLQKMMFKQFSAIESCVKIHTQK